MRMTERFDLNKRDFKSFLEEYEKVYKAPLILKKSHGFKSGVKGDALTLRRSRSPIKYE